MFIRDQVHWLSIAQWNTVIRHQLSRHTTDALRYVAGVRCKNVDDAFCQLEMCHYTCEKKRCELEPRVERPYRAVEQKRRVVNETEVMLDTEMKKKWKMKKKTFVSDSIVIIIIIIIIIINVACRYQQWW